MSDNPHVRYLLFGWLGVMYGMVMGYALSGLAPHAGIYMLFGAMIVGPLVTSICQSHYIKKHKKPEAPIDL